MKPIEDPRTISLRTKLPEPKADHSHPSRSELKNEWNYITIGNVHQDSELWLKLMN